MIRVGKTKRVELQAKRDVAWAGYVGFVARCARHKADRAANRPVSVYAARDMSTMDTYARMYMAADYAAKRCGV